MTRRAKLFVTSVAGFALLGMAVDTLACELQRPIKLADSNWDTIQLFNSVSKIILEKGYGCHVELVSGDMVALVIALNSNDVDVFMDFVIVNNQELWEKAKKQGAVDLGANYSDSVQGWYVPRYFVYGDKLRGIKASAPNLKSVVDLNQYASVFSDPEETSKGRFLNCPIGWGCEQVNNKKLDDYGVAHSFVNFRPGSRAALDSVIVSAFKRGEPVITYYWAPSWLLGVYDMVKLDEPACDSVARGKSCASPFISSHTIASGKFVAAAPKTAHFFASIKTSSTLLSSMLSYMKFTSGATRSDVAMNFLRNHREVWTKWVSADVADKVVATL